MTDAALIELLRAELPRLVGLAVRAELAALAPGLSPAQRGVMKTLAGLYEAGEPFTAASALDAARFDPAMLAGLRSACDADPQRMGILLGQTADLRAVFNGLRLVRLPREAGVRRWVLEAVESL